MSPAARLTRLGLLLGLLALAACGQRGPLSLPEPEAAPPPPPAGAEGESEDDER